MNYQGFIWAGLFVEDMERSVAFYRDILGLRFLRQGENWAHFDAGNGTLFELFSGGKRNDLPKDPEHQSMILGFKVDDLDQVVETLQLKGVNFNGEIGQYRSQRWAHFSDPEGNRLEIKEVAP